MTRTALAEAQWLAGSVDRAIACPESISGDAHRALGWEPQQAMIAARVQLAEVYLQKGNEAGARTIVDFLSRIWSEADPDLPLARRLTHLRARLEPAGR